MTGPLRRNSPMDALAPSPDLPRGPPRRTSGTTVHPRPTTDFGPIVCSFCVRAPCSQSEIPVGGLCVPRESNRKEVPVRDGSTQFGTGRCIRLRHKESRRHQLAQHQPAAPWPGAGRFPAALCCSSHCSVVNRLTSTRSRPRCSVTSAAISALLRTGPPLVPLYVPHAGRVAIRRDRVRRRRR